MVRAPGLQQPRLRDGQRRDREDHVRAGQHVAVDDGGAGLAVGVVRGEGVPPGAGLDDDVEPFGHQLADGVGHQRDPALARTRLGRDPNSHDRPT